MQVEFTEQISLEKAFWGKFTKMVVREMQSFFLSPELKHCHRIQNALGPISMYFGRNMNSFALLPNRVPYSSGRELPTKPSQPLKLKKNTLAVSETDNWNISQTLLHRSQEGGNFPCQRGKAYILFLGESLIIGLKQSCTNADTEIIFSLLFH